MRQLFLCAALSVLVAGATGYLMSDRSAAVSASETALQKVERTGVIRCGYIVYPPYLIKDPNTEKMSGIGFDYMQEIARELNLRLEWAEETGWGTYPEGLNTGRYDLVCTPVWQSGTRARAAMLSRPLFYDSMYAYALADDRRFDKSLETLNDRNVRIAVVESDAEQNVRRLRFPEAQEVALSAAADASHSVLSVVTGKADVAFDVPANVERFNAHSPQKLKPIAGGTPVQLCGNTLAAKQGEIAFINAINAAADVLDNDGRTQAILKKYGTDFKSVR